MRRNHAAVLVLSGVFGLSGCLTPSEGRTMDMGLGGAAPPDRPVSVSDARDAHLSGTMYKDQENIADMRAARHRSWDFDPLAQIYYERSSNTCIGLDPIGHWHLLVGSESHEYLFEDERAVHVVGRAPILVERALDVAGY
jgi:hypothetical protein